MRKVSMATRTELVAAISCRYALGGRAEKARMLDEFVALTGFHRKHAMRLLRGEREPRRVVLGQGAGFTAMTCGQHSSLFGRRRIEFAASDYTPCCQH